MSSDLKNSVSLVEGPVSSQEDGLETQIQNIEIPTNPNAKVIKRYQNRKLYDTQQSCYVTLEDIAKMIRNQEEVVVIDNKTKRDITSSTLTQIIFEAEKKNKNFISIETLREIIQTGAGSVSSYLEKILARPVTENGVKAIATGSGDQDVRQLLESTTRSFNDLQRKLDDRLAQPSPRNEISGVQEGINKLHETLSSIETKIRQYTLDN